MANKDKKKIYTDLAFGGFSAKGNHLTFGTSGLPLPQTHNQNQTNNKQNIEDGINSNSLFSRVQNHDNFPLSSTMRSVSPGTYHQYDGNNRQDPDNSDNTKHINKFFHISFRFFNNQTARTTPTIPAEPLIVNSLKNSKRVRFLENIETTGMAANQPAARLVKSPDTTSNTSLSEAQDFIQQINPNISMTYLQYFQTKNVKINKRAVN